MKSKSEILIFDFGSQTTHLISRRLRDLGVEAEIVDPETPIEEIQKMNPAGIILSGGPASVYEKNAPTLDKKILNLGIPILGICYGHQLLAYLLGGEIREKGIEEYGPATLVINRHSKILTGLSPHSRVWMSHGDTVKKTPSGFSFVA